MAIDGRFWVGKEDRAWISQELQGQVSSEQVDKVCQAIADLFSSQARSFSNWAGDVDYKRLKAQKKAEKKARKAAKKQAKLEAVLTRAELSVNLQPNVSVNVESMVVRDQVSAQDIHSFLLGKGAQLALNEAWGGKGLKKHGEAFLVKWMNKWYGEGLEHWIGPLLDIPEDQLGAALGRLYQPRYHHYQQAHYAQVVRVLEGEDVSLDELAKALLADFEEAAECIEDAYQELFRAGMLEGMRLKAQ